MTETPFGGIYVCTGRLTHPLTAVQVPPGKYGPVHPRDIRTVVEGKAPNRPKNMTPTTRFELHCPYIYPNGQLCRRTLRIGEDIFSRFAGVVQAFNKAGIKEFDISLMPF